MTSRAKEKRGFDDIGLTLNHQIPTTRAPLLPDNEYGRTPVFVIGPKRSDNKFQLRPDNETLVSNFRTLQHLLAHEWQLRGHRQFRLNPPNASLDP